MKLKGGIKIQEQGEAVQIQGTTRFDPNRQRNNTQKRLDDMLFGGHHPKPKKVPEGKPITKPTKPEIQRKIPTDYKQSQQSLNTGNQHSQESFNAKTGFKRTEEAVIFERQNMFNRPAYIRKLRKVAEQFDFKNQNVNNHNWFEIIRPIECDRAMMCKIREPNFSDIEFPPNQRAFNTSQKELGIQWTRGSNLPINFSLGKYIDPNDIQPGLISSHEFLSVLSCLAQKQSNIKRLIQDQKISPDGFYFVRLNLSSVWRYLVLDDYIPMRGGQPVCATSYLDNQVDSWVYMIEKAYAKAYGATYDIFSRITPHQYFLRDLTGAPIQTYAFDNPNTLIKIKQAVERGDTILAIPNQSIAKVGLNPRNALSVVGMKGNLQLRNSWGTTQQKSQLPINNQGIFELNPKQCKDLLSHVSISRVQQNYYSTTIQSKHESDAFSTFTFALQEYVDGTFTLTQQDERRFPTHQKYSYSPFRFIIEKKLGSTFIMVGSAYSLGERNVDVEVNLTPGQYHIHCIAQWVDRPYDFFFSFYGTKKLDIKKVYSRQFPSIVYQSLQQQSQQKGDSDNKGNVVEFIYYHQNTNLLVITVQNISGGDTQYTVDLSRAKVDHLTLLNAKNPNQSFKGMNRQQLRAYKQGAMNNRKWPVHLKKGQLYSWVLSTSQAYNPDNLKRWGIA